jgi:hypothetical protein
MSVPPLPPPLAQLGRRPFSFYPAILNVQHNQWIYESATWSDVLVRNTQTNEEVSVPRRYLGEVSRVDAPLMIVGLRAELEYRSGAVWPAERRVIEMPLAVNDSPRMGLAHTPATRAPVVGIRLESTTTTRFGKLAAGGVALGMAGCVLAISLFRGGVIGSRVFYAPVVHADLPLSPLDNYAGVVRQLGPPAREHWRWEPGEPEYGSLAYPRRGLYVILKGRTQSDARYIGTMDWNWHPVQAEGANYRVLERLPRF